MRRTVSPSAEIQDDDRLAAGKGMVMNRRRCSGTREARRRLIIQRRSRRSSTAGRVVLLRASPRARAGLKNDEAGRRTGFVPGICRPARASLRSRSAGVPHHCAVRVQASRVALQTAASDRSLKALVIGGFVRGLSMRDIESLCEEVGVGKLSRSTVARICAELHERFEGFERWSLYDTDLVVLSLTRSIPGPPSGPKEGAICAGERSERPQATGLRAVGIDASQRKTGSSSGVISRPAG